MLRTAATSSTTGKARCAILTSSKTLADTAREESSETACDTQTGTCGTTPSHLCCAEKHQLDGSARFHAFPEQLTPPLQKNLRIHSKREGLRARMASVQHTCKIIYVTNDPSAEENTVPSAYLNETLPQQFCPQRPRKPSDAASRLISRGMAGQRIYHSRTHSFQQLCLYKTTHVASRQVFAKRSPATLHNR